jgi:hypothetical protein
MKFQKLKNRECLQEYYLKIYFSQNRENLPTKKITALVICENKLRICVVIRRLGNIVVPNTYGCSLIDPQVRRSSY